ncbi:hypothetical protein [Streptomyces sp. NPDC088246]|uniref:hypothetical protein n=1 Tax=Streptomyces sp. NPDC088246 TaxID=3365842 RepID=UPI0037FBBF20
MTFITAPQPRLGMFSPQRSGRVMFQHACEALGHAPWCALDWQLPQAPPPALEHGPQALPQQNQLVSPAHRLVDPQAIVLPLPGNVTCMTSSRPAVDKHI